jgi:hypothetical protein
MQQVVNALAVLAFLGVVLLLFGCSALLHQVRELRGAVLTGGATSLGASVLPQFANQRGRVTALLVVDEHCRDCRERVAGLAGLAGSAGLADVVVVGNSGAVAGWPTAPGVRVETDPALWNSLAVSATPTLVTLDPTGGVLRRQVVGSDEELAAALAAEPPAPARR